MEVCRDVGLPSSFRSVVIVAMLGSHVELSGDGEREEREGRRGVGVVGEGEVGVRVTGKNLQSGSLGTGAEVVNTLEGLDYRGHKRKFTNGGE